MAKYESIPYSRKDFINIIDILITTPNFEPSKDHYHRSLEIIMPIIGNAVVTKEYEHKVVYPGEIYILNSGERHGVTGELDQGIYKGFVFQIPYQTLTFASENIENIKFGNSKSFQNIIIEILYKILILDNNEYKYKHIDIAQRTLELVKALLEYGVTEGDMHKQSIIQKEITKVISYIEAHYNEDLSVKDLADRFSYSYRYFERIFKNVVGMTTMQYIREVQLKYAIELLIETDKSINVISETVGFPNVKSMQNLFKKKYNMTCDKYRKLNG